MGQKLNHLDDAFVEEQVFGLLDFTNWKCISGWETLQWNLHGGNALQKWSNSAEKHWKSSFEVVYQVGSVNPSSERSMKHSNGMDGLAWKSPAVRKNRVFRKCNQIEFFCNCKFLCCKICQLIDGEKLDIEGDAVRDSSGVSHLQRELVPGLKREQLGRWNV